MEEFSLADKEAFAYAWHKDPSQSIVAAQRALNLELGEAMRAQTILCRDQTVLNFKAELDKNVNIPSRNEFAAMVLRGASESLDNGSPKHDGKTRALMWKLAAEVLGYTTVGDTGKDKSNSVSNLTEAQLEAEISKHLGKENG
jgi:hypothetical protein